ncbi:hypothetical protein SAMD00023353_0500490 [Rosellinia necatrix]|uniref:Uncharacterized protein n=1 Tax=Rosellinia necatrix TaxID=77044 RepID=A0A1S8A5H5_ROSNE|nr:hypothetical protein SAMD00023353_0500490 [Rosellinia necatrix]
MGVVSCDEPKSASDDQSIPRFNPPSKIPSPSPPLELPPLELPSPSPYPYSQSLVRGATDAGSPPKDWKRSAPGSNAELCQSKW